VDIEKVHFVCLIFWGFPPTFFFHLCRTIKRCMYLNAHSILGVHVQYAGNIKLFSWGERLSLWKLLFDMLETYFTFHFLLHLPASFYLLRSFYFTSRDSIYSRGIRDIFFFCYRFQREGGGLPVRTLSTSVQGITHCYLFFDRLQKLLPTTTTGSYRCP
jgi:hypothetical protein